MPRRLGQHFLHSSSILRRIAEVACPQRVSRVVEIGPGRGALTGPLLERADEVIAIEVDGALAASLSEKHRDEPRLRVIHADILTVDLKELAAPVIAGNLPYYIASAILEKVLPLGRPLERAVFLIQREVADRLTAVPGTRDYGYLSVFTQFYSHPRIAFAVPPGAFQPPPKVDSAVVSLDILPSAEHLAVEEPKEFLRFAGWCFRQKRKTLRNNLAGVYGRERLDEMPEAPLRAEQLSLEQLAAFYRKLESAKRYT